MLLIVCCLTACGTDDSTIQSALDENVGEVASGDVTDEVVLEGTDFVDEMDMDETDVTTKLTATPEPQLTATPEPVKTQVEVDLTGLAKGYSNYMYDECMELSTTFGLFDITGDGIPELFSGQGADVVTYWQGETWSLVCDMVLLEWYYNEETKELGCYYFWDDNGYIDEWILFYAIDTTIGEYLWQWVQWSEQIKENVDLSQYIHIDGQAFDKESNKDAGMMAETLKSWFESQEEYEYIY